LSFYSISLLKCLLLKRLTYQNKQFCFNHFLNKVEFWNDVVCSITTF
jgi:hypothetical protein